jgi:hypothetical protein
LGDESKKIEVDRSCSMHRDRRSGYTGFCWGNLRERDCLEDLCVNGRIILNGFQEIGWEAIN